MRRGAASRSSLRAPPPFNKRPPVRRGSGSGGWLAGREGSGVPHAPASWVWATARCQPRSCLGVHAGLGRGSPSLELRPPLGHTALSPRPAGHELKHPTACTQALGEMGVACCLGGAEECGPPHPLAGSPQVLGLGSAPRPPGHPATPPWPDWFGSPIRSVLPGQGGWAVPGQSLPLWLWAVRHPSSPPGGVREAALSPQPGVWVCSRRSVASWGCGGAGAGAGAQRACTTGR